jgi:DNA-binding protein H-NS
MFSLESTGRQIGESEKRGIVMASLQDLLDRKAALEKEIESTRKQERAEAISKVRALMSQYGLTAADLNSKAAPKAGGSGKGGKVAIKYRNTATGDTWSGRGLQPKWLKAAIAAGRKVEDFAVK